ncbi:hypothetical protein [Bosea sp. AS-1]|uniref:hypothetical protein n=1 Tax=Bosea sp. AS-1 TaxID=2015316 RepID=UPI000B797D0D|nr:hypothetical protein [Bosea sp. AS-1]
MLLEIAQAIVADVKARHSEGDCPVTRQHSVENLEDALLSIASIPPAATSGSEAGGEADATQKLLDKALTVLGRCHTVLFNMAKENEGAIFNRWPIHHEPLRSDARNLLPLIDEVLGDD